MVILLRVVQAILLAGVAAIAAVPLFLVFDLVSGGTALGLCPNGLARCEPGYFSGIELFGILLVVLFVAVGGIGLCAAGIRRVQSAKYQVTSTK
ncbi:MAG: hypothetical protein IIC70_04665 [Acidobacteria bacterium]|nr:hypothetical protein [Acidobacteriota bacterium]MCH8129180.1 hypothetical protein [Acidobacteriota bacterium]MCH8990989.1 hypothetical protein [Acidobacteriota bacterium]